MILYGDGDFASSMRGVRSAPTTALRKACEVACGVLWVRLADEHRTTKCCSRCGCVLDRVSAVVPARVHKAAAAREARALPPGWTPTPARPIPKWRLTRGLYYCTPCAAQGRGFRHRDFDAALLLLRSELHKEAHGGVPLPFLQRGRHAEASAGRFFMEPQ